MNGFADLHNHQFAYLGFGGIAFHGKAFGDMPDALPWCTAAHGALGTNDFIGNILKSTYYDSPSLGHRVGGYPQFDGWPRWDSITHQAVYEDWLYRAVQGGLRLMVMLAVNSEYLCTRPVVPKILNYGCDDMPAVDRQLAAAREMEAYVDQRNGGPGQGWYRIVSTPHEARAVIEAGKLAVVLGIEVDYLFGCHAEGDLTEDALRQKLDEYYARGVRHIFPLHFGDNGFGGTAFQNPLELAVDAPYPSPVNPLRTLPDAYQIHTESAPVGSGYEMRTGRRNVQGMTNLGKTLIHEMIARGMIIDVDHMSARSKADTFAICEAEAYPVVSSHTGFVEISRGEKRHEGQLLPEEIERIRRLGGMVAVIVHQGKLDEIDTWQGPGQPVIPHTRGNTSNTLVQAYLYAVSKMQGGPVGFGTDFNGFAGLPGPRYDSESEAASGGVNYNNFVAITTGLEMPRSVVGEKTFSINVDGLAHVGMLPDLIADFQAMGLSANDLQPLLHSAEGYVKLWEKALAPVLALDPRKYINLGTVPGTQNFEVSIANQGTRRGTLPLNITGCTISPSNMQSVFQVGVPTGGINIPAGSSANLTGTFHPTTPGIYEANMEIISDDPFRNPVIQLVGIAGPIAFIQVSLPPPRLRSRQSFTFTIENYGNRALTINAITLRENPDNTTANAFRIQVQTPRVLNFGESMQFSVVFDPASGGRPPSDNQPSPPRQYGAQVLIDSDADNGPHPFSIELQGSEPPECESLREQLVDLQDQLVGAQGIQRRNIMQQINVVRVQMGQLGCG